MKRLVIFVGLGVLIAVLAACGGKKKSEDIIAPRIEKVQLKAPIRMQDYTDERDVAWIGKTYHVTIARKSSDSLEMIKDEVGQKYVDNIFTVMVSRSDGSVFFKRSFTKASLNSYLDDDFRKTGLFEGFVYDKAEGDWLVFGASVGHPQTDEYIPLVIRLSRMGELVIKRDVQMDTDSQTEPATDDSI